MAQLDPDFLAELRRKAVYGQLPYRMKWCPECDCYARVVAPGEFMWSFPGVRPNGQIGRCCLDCGWLHIKKPLSDAALRQQVLDSDGRECVYCGAHTRLQIDHVIPEVLGGPSTFENLVTACKSCNSKKGFGATATMRFGRFRQA